MATVEIKLPDIGEGVTEGELVKWLVKEGDSIKADQPVAEVMTDKATVEIPSSVAGSVKELKAKEGEILKIGTVMIVLESGAGTSVAASTTTNAPTVAKPASSPAAPSPANAFAAKSAPVASTAYSNGGNSGGAGLDVYPPAAGAGVLATPSTRRLAREMNIDINALSGSGIAGRVTREDVLSKGSDSGSSRAGGAGAVSVPRPAYQGPAGAVEERVAIRGIRRKIAEQMQMAKHIIPHFTLMDEANVSELVEMRENLKEQGVKVTYMPFVIKALIATCRDFPMMNASIDDAAQEIVYKKYFNIGFAADTPQGLLVPVVKNADHKTIGELANEVSELSKKARDGKLSLDEMKGATITITNIGSVGGTYATPIINHPEVAIFGMYKISDKPVWDSDLNTWIPQKFMNFTITADHRLIDGAVAANFLKAFIDRIQNPGRLMMDMM